MGILISCCRPQASEVITPDSTSSRQTKKSRKQSKDVDTTPDSETRRRQLVEAAERRREAESRRGIKDPEKVKRMQERSAEVEKKEKEMEKEGGATLKWTTS